MFEELKGFQNHIDGIARVLAADRVQREEVLGETSQQTQLSEIRQALIGGDLAPELDRDIKSRLSAAGVDSTADIQRADINTLRSILTDVRASQTQGEVRIIA